MKRNTKELLGLLAFVSLLIFTLSFILNRIGIHTSFVSYVGYGFALFVVIVMAKFYVEQLSNLWKIIFYVIAAFAILDFLFNIF